MPETEVVIIGAGAFGLSISAHLSARNVDHVVVGRVMNTYKSHSPVGMLMKSEPYASAIAAPADGYDVGAYCALQQVEYSDRVGPLTLERFLEYADWYADKLVPGVRDDTVTNVTWANGKFQVDFAGSDSITARQVVVATGVLPYAYLPPVLAAHSPGLVTHTSDHHQLDEFKGRTVAVVGGGQSALETTALLNEAGADVHVVARAKSLSWNDQNPEELSRLGRLKRPTAQLCEGWKCAFWNTPRAFRVLPENYRIEKAKTVLGPAGSWWLKDRIIGAVDVIAGHSVREAVSHGEGLRLVLDGPRQSVDVDHVIAGTGFRVDVARLPFLPAELRASVNVLNGHPLVSRAGETSVPGLYFAGAPTVLTIGPSARFIAGTYTLAKPLTRSVAQRARSAGRS